MPNPVLIKKLEQIKTFLRELNELLLIPFQDFRKDMVKIRAAERDFQLIVDLAADINTSLLIEKTGKTPDSYRQSFLNLAGISIISDELSKALAKTAQLRNILVHEYDFEEDFEKFYDSAKESIPFYKQYIKTILTYIENN